MATEVSVHGVTKTNKYVYTMNIHQDVLSVHAVHVYASPETSTV